MIFRRRVVGAYLCPRGAYAVDCKTASGGIEIVRSLDVPALLDSPVQASDHLIQLLTRVGILRADVAIAIRGFGSAHHILQLPPASDAMLAPIIEREIIRLEPQLGEPVVGWVPLPAADSAATPESGPQRSVLAAAVPRDVVQVIERRLGAAGYRVLHLTALPAAMQRLVEEFEEGKDSTALVAPLPDGAFIGFSLGGGLRLVVEPPLPAGAEHDAAALAEEVELGAMFVRQQFRGVEIDRVVLVGSSNSLPDAESAITERLHLPTTQLGTPDLTPAALAALGAVLDANSPKPLSLGGETRKRSELRARSTIDTIALAAVLVFAVVCGWTILQAVRTKRTTDALAVARSRIEHDAFGLSPVRTTANQRKFVRDALGVMRLVATDRVQLQEALTGIAAAVRSPVLLDSVHLDRRRFGWRAMIGGRVAAMSNARAVQSIHDLYREIPQRLTVDSLRLEELVYSDSTGADQGAAVVRFQISFMAPTGKRD